MTERRDGSQTGWDEVVVGRGHMTSTPKITLLQKIFYKSSKAKVLLYKSMKNTNSNYINNNKDCKSIIEYYSFINRLIVFWYNKKQQTISTFIIEAK